VIRRDFNVTCVFTCFDPSDEGFLAATRQIAAKKSAFKVIRQLPTEGSFDAAFAHHALHHVGDLETLFTFVRRAIGPDGVFVISDMIGRNGHQRWPEAKRLAERLFSKLPSVLGAAPRDFIMRSDPPSPPTPALLSRAHMYTRDAGAI
jgi:SAM-dependent methyltransferase